MLRMVRQPPLPLVRCRDSHVLLSSRTNTSNNRTHLVTSVPLVTPPSPLIPTSSHTDTLSYQHCYPLIQTPHYHTQHNQHVGVPVTSVPLVIPPSPLTPTPFHPLPLHPPFFSFDRRRAAKAEESRGGATPSCRRLSPQACRGQDPSPQGRQGPAEGGAGLGGRQQQQQQVIILSTDCACVFPFTPTNYTVRPSDRLHLTSPLSSTIATTVSALRSPLLSPPTISNNH